MYCKVLTETKFFAEKNREKNVCLQSQTLQAHVFLYMEEGIGFNHLSLSRDRPSQIRCFSLPKVL